ncbi:hypothetical protein K488DRAFT_48504 [Vararia minispora EC-137]|uniref:Uncharacterized protein n=1 Tax=Vararia minispora EC-137 TaxID=1314806 RepID=A0ACB8QML6_9AGAM|nr:hypothetical protein K488DRAFT_48504 [Vararia minispora EC-137]
MPAPDAVAQAALSDAFSVPSLPREPASSSSPVAASESDSAFDTVSPPEPQTMKPDAEAEALGPEAFASWKAEYDAQLERWKAENAEQRARAEAERAKWEEIRRRERTAGAPPNTNASTGRSEPGIESWEKVLAARHAAGDSPSPVDARNVVTGEKRGAPAPSVSAAALPQSQTDPGSSPRWEDVPSDPSELTSSFPSLSFPETSQEHSKHASGATSSPTAHTPHHHHHHHHHDTNHRHHHPAGTENAASATLAVFDGTLSARTRLWALAGALSINLLLPFVNGVMLGVGEIFAKDVLMSWLGWNTPARTSGVGMRTGSWFRRRS